jgi:formate-dependent nitrite reductase membrane component NrfD
MQRKEPAFVPALISLLAALAGGVWALFVARSAVADKRAKTGEIVTFNFAHGVTAIVAGLVAAYAVFKTSYLDPPTWEIGFVPVLALMVGVAAAAAGGAAAGAATAFALAKQSRRRKKKRDEAEAAAADSGAATEPPAPQ